MARFESCDVVSSSIGIVCCCDKFTAFSMVRFSFFEANIDFANKRWIGKLQRASVQRAKCRESTHTFRAPYPHIAFPIHIYHRRVNSSTEQSGLSSDAVTEGVVNDLLIRTGVGENRWNYKFAAVLWVIMTIIGMAVGNSACTWEFIDTSMGLNKE